jgi:hypothetical protein
LTLLEGALAKDPGSIRGWLLAREILASPRATLEQKRRWSEAIDRLAGLRHPDFAFDMFAPIFEATEDPEACWQLWDWAATRYIARPDLAARARFEQARLLLRHDRKLDAGAAAWEVFEQFSDAGPIAVEALAFAAHMLEEAGRRGEMAGLYERAWRKLKQPGKMHEGARQQSSWYRVGVRYADLLAASGDSRGAANVRRRLAP